MDVYNTIIFLDVMMQISKEATNKKQTHRHLRKELSEKNGE